MISQGSARQEYRALCNSLQACCWHGMRGHPVFGPQELFAEVLLGGRCARRNSFVCKRKFNKSASLQGGRPQHNAAEHLVLRKERSVRGIYRIYAWTIPRGEILHLYEDFSYGAQHPALKTHVLLAEHDSLIQAAHRVPAGHTQCGPEFLADGRWVVSNNLSSSFHTTCVSQSDTFDACSEAAHPVN